MSKDWDSHLEQWTDAGLINTALAGRIRDWERGQAPLRGLRWPILVALAFGAILVAAGVLLFVSAHWDQMPPDARMALVVLMVALFHAGGAAVSQRFEGLSVTLHAIGTVTLGAAIALAGQIYNLAEHWPSAVMLWAIGAALAWAFLGQWPQAALTAILVPAWPDLQPCGTLALGCHAVGYRGRPRLGPSPPMASGSAHGYPGPRMACLGVVFLDLRCRKQLHLARGCGTMRA